MALQDTPSARGGDARAGSDRAHRPAERLRRGLIWLAPFLIALAGYLFAMRQMQPPFTADEPHYALEAFSLALDGDRDLANDYASPDRVLAATDGQTTTLQPHAYHFTADGPFVSSHHVGLPLLLLPAARISQTVDALQLELVLLAAIAAQLLFGILAKVVPRHQGLRWAVWAAVVFSLPLVGYSTRLYPEMPGALLVLGVVRILLSDRLRVWQIVLAGVLIGYLPWLHVRFGLLAAGLILAVLVRLLELHWRGSRRALAVGVLALGVPVVVSLGVMAIEFHRWYGTSSLTVQLHASDYQPKAPAAPAPDAAPSEDSGTGSAVPAPTPSASPAAAPESPSLLEVVHADDVVPGVARSLFSSRSGWIPFVPVGVLAVAGAIALVLRRRWWVALGLGVALAYLVQIASAGVLPAYALPGRFEIVFVPLLAVPLLMVLTQVRWTRWLFWPLAGIGAILTVFGMTHAGGLVQFTPGKARADIGAANVFLRPWPTVSRESTAPQFADAIGVCDSRHPVGTVHGCGPGGYVEATASDGSGVIWTGGAREVPAGEYSIAVALSRAGDATAGGGTAARIEFVANGAVVVGQDVPVDAIAQGTERTFIRQVKANGPATLGVRVSTTGAVPLRMPAASIRAATTALTGVATQGPRLPDAGAVAVWFVVLFGLAGAIAVSLRPKGSPSPS